MQQPNPTPSKLSMPAVVAIIGAIGLVLLFVLACEPRPPTGTEAPSAEPPTDNAAASDAPKDTATPTSAVDSDTILLGEVASLTGGEATFGISTRNGIDLAIQEANAQGGVLLVEQNAQLALRFAHYAYVLETGTVAMERTGEALLASDAVRRAYLGE